jgi:hypothetical protein
MAGIIGLFLSSLCVVKVVRASSCLLLIWVLTPLQRQEIERFRRIDAKRGGRGFV